MSTNAKILIAVVSVLAVTWLLRGHRESGSDAVSPERRAQSIHIARQVEGITARRHLDEQEWENKLAAGRAKLEARAAALHGAQPNQPGEPGQPMSSVPEAVARGAKFESLRSTATSDPDPDERADALETAAAMYDDDQALQLLRDGLKDPDPEVRLAALDDLWLQSDDLPFDELRTALSDDDADVRLEAVKILNDGDDDDERVQSLLKIAADDPDEDVSSEAQDMIELNAQ